MSDGTVHIRIAIQISVDDEVDTGLTVEQWNGMTAEDRQRVVEERWDVVAQDDGGGMSVVTDGAEGI